MRILYINNDGGGFADYVEVPAGTTIATFLEQNLPSGKAADYLIRVNRQPTPSDYVLQDGDRVSCTPTKIEGAAGAGGRKRASRPLAIRTPWSLIMAAFFRSRHLLKKGAKWEPGNGSTACT